MSRRARRPSLTVPAANDDRTLALMGTAAMTGDTDSLLRLASTLTGDHNAAIGLASLAGIGLRSIFTQAAADVNVGVDRLVDAVLMSWLGVDAPALERQG